MFGKNITEYSEVVNGINDKQNYIYVSGDAKTDQRYALSLEKKVHSLITSSFDTYKIGDSESFITPYYTSESKHVQEISVQYLFSFADDLVIGDEIMNKNEWDIKGGAYTLVKWDRTIVKPQKCGQMVTTTYKHVYPGANIEILARRKHDYYEVITIMNDMKNKMYDYHAFWLGFFYISKNVYLFVYMFVLPYITRSYIK